VLDALQSVATATVRWLTLGRDVVVRGDTGSGLSTVLAAVSRSGARSGLGTVLVDWHDLGSRPLPLGPGPRPARGTDEVVDDLVGDLGARGVLLIDDVDTLDDATLEVLDRVLRRSAARFVATAARDVVRSGRPALTRLLAGRSPAEVRIPPLGYQAMARLITERLGGAPDVALVSSVTAWSAGNPAVAVAIVDAAQFGGAVERRGETWAAVRDLDDMPLDAVAYLMAAGLPRGAQGALELLAVLGPASVDLVHRLVPEADLAVLVERGRVVSYGGDGEDQLAVSPPALARAVRARMSEPRRLEIAGVLVAEVGGHDLPMPTVRTGLTDMILAASGEHYEAYWRWAAELTGLVHERAVVDEGSARAAWEETPTVATALPYLVTLLRRPAATRTRDVLAGTPRTADEEPGPAALFDVLHEYWQQWQTRAASDSRVDLGVPATGDAPHRIGSSALHALVAEAEAERWDDDALVRAIGIPGPGTAEPARSLAVMRAAAVLLEAGRPAAVVRITEDVEVPAWMPAEAEHSILGIRGMALLLLDRVADAETFARARLEAAYDSLDLAGIRVHSVTLAHALTVTGQWTAAWRVVSTALRLGPPGPLGSAFYRRSLTLATMLASLVENADVARMLLADLRHARPLHQPVVDPMQGVAEAYVLLGEGQEDEADALMWRSGARALLAGRPMPALEYWTLRVSPSTADQVRQMRDLADRVPLPLFAPLVDLHAALLGQDLAALDGAARAARLEMVPGLGTVVVQTLDDLRVAAGLPPLTDAEVDDLLGERLAEALREAPPVHRSADVLSEREHEVAALAAEGLTDREIAERLHLSRRTVENHMHRALRKLGVPGRKRLAEAVL
jgi:DNA-binding CsgD family transcriptional regulator